MWPDNIRSLSFGPSCTSQGNSLFGPFTINVLYPVLAWIGVMALGYSIGKLYAEGYDQGKRRKQLLYIGIGAHSPLCYTSAENTYMVIRLIGIFRPVQYSAFFHI
jgi:uncharacterized membrane protein